MKKKHIPTKPALIISGLLAISYFILTAFYSTNVPVLDDFKQIFFFLNTFYDSSTISEKITLLFSGHNKHIILTFRIILIALYSTFGEINIVHLNIIGSTFLVLTFLFLIYSTKTRDKLLLIPLGILLFTPLAGHIEWAGGNLHYNALIFFSYIATYLNSKESSFTRYITTALFALVCSLTLGSGLFIIPILIAQIIIDKKRYSIKYIAQGIAITLILFSIYFLSIKINSNENTSSLLSFLQPDEITVVALNFLTFFGSYLKYIIDDSYYWMSSILGSFLLYLFLQKVINYRKVEKEKKHLIFFGMFIIVTAALAAVIRAPEWGIIYSSVPRYQPFSVLFSGVIILLYSTYLTKNRAYGVLLLFAIIVSIPRVAQNIKELDKRKVKAQSIANDIFISNEKRLHFPNKTLAMSWIEDAMKSHIYKPPVAIKNFENFKKIKLPKNSQPNCENIYSLYSFFPTKVYGQNIGLLKGWIAFPKKINVKSVYLLAKGKNETLIEKVTPDSRPRHDVIKHFKEKGQRGLNSIGFSIAIHFDNNINPDEKIFYGILIRTNDNKEYVCLKQSI